jgi:hypothetical protein
MTRRHSIDEQADNTPWVKALAKVRLMATRERYCYQHVQAIRDDSSRTSSRTSTRPL